MSSGPGSNSPDHEQPTLPPSTAGDLDHDATIAPTTTSPESASRFLPQLEDYELLEELSCWKKSVV